MNTSNLLDRDDPPILGANPLVGLTRTQVAAALARLARHVAVDPALVLATGLRAGADLAEVTIGRSSVKPAKGDKRFAHPAWAHNPIYRRLVQAYLVDAAAVMRLVDDVDLDQKSRERARFALTLLVEAMAPTNTLAGNPSALAKAVETRGRSLLTGLRHLAGDIRRNGGMPSTVDTGPFRVGDNIATTAGHVVHRTDVFELIQYEAQTEMVVARPLVAIPPQINKYYITDLAPDRSLVEHMVRAGFSYFAMSWRNPTAAHRDWNLDTYVAACKEAIDVACEITGAEVALDDDSTTGTGCHPGVRGLVTGRRAVQRDEDRRDPGRRQLGDGARARPAQNQVGSGIGKIHAVDKGDDTDQQASPGGIGSSPHRPHTSLVDPATAGMQHLQGRGLRPMRCRADQRLVDAVGAVAPTEHQQGAAPRIQVKGRQAPVPQRSPVQAGQLGPDWVTDDDHPLPGRPQRGRRLTEPQGDRHRDTGRQPVGHARHRVLLVKHDGNPSPPGPDRDG